MQWNEHKWHDDSCAAVLQSNVSKLEDLRALETCHQESRQTASLENWKSFEMSWKRHMHYFSIKIKSIGKCRKIKKAKIKIQCIPIWVIIGEW